MKRRKNQKRRGAAAVEFAIVAPLMFLLLVGMIECGRVMMVQHVITMAAREGAREAILVGSTQASVEQVISDYAANISNADKVVIALSTNPAEAESGDLITANVTIPVRTVSLLSSTWFDSDDVLTGTATMRKEGID